jgi:hypothetical protein
MSLKASFVSFLHLKYPSLEASLLDSVISDRLISPFQVELRAAQVEVIKSEIKKYWKLREWGAHHLSEKYLSYGLRKSQNYSACMSYDFHLNSEGQPELIEINTNAAFLALGLELYQFLNLPQSFSEAGLIKMFKDEGATDSIAIIDEKPASQRLFIEFLIYQKLFEKHGLRSEIFDIDETERLKEFSLTYNRYTDFYLNSEAAAPLREAFNSGHVQLSPTPYEYFLLADKQRLLDWNQQSDVEKPASLLKIYDLAVEDRDKIWSERKQLFFKPKNAFGGKQTYKGASMSRKIFDDVFKPDFVAQQLSVPPELEVVMDNAPVKFKYDLRCFAYKDELQLIVARLYQGQTTNLQTAGGGFAAIKIN